MSISLKKGQKVSLVKDNNDKLTEAVVGLGWDEISSGGFFKRIFKSDIDCDALAILLKNGKLEKVPRDIVYFSNLRHNTGSVVHLGDNLTGKGDGDDEQIVVDFSKIPDDYDKVIFAVNIYKADERKQHFGMIKNAFIRVVDKNGKEICRYNLTEDYSGYTAMIFAEVYRDGNAWVFNAIGKGTDDLSIKSIARRYL